MKTFLERWKALFISADGGVEIASIPGAPVSALIPSRVKLMTFKLVFTVSLPNAQHQRDSAKNKPASLLAGSS